MSKILASFVPSLVTALAIAACAPAGAPTPGAQEGAGGAAPSAPQRALTVIIRQELPSLASKPLVAFSGSLYPPRYLFNAELTYTDEKEVSHPYLAEALPQLNTDTWRVFPDGRMETTYKLRPNLTWHDGTPLLAEDFVFSMNRVYATPELTRPLRELDQVLAPDPRTILIRWRLPYPDAGTLSSGFPALPRHILAEPFQAVAGGDTQVFVNHPFWAQEYVGLGPYKVVNWELGAFIEAAAFDGHALGRPKIDRLRLLPIGDPNTALANMLSGEGHYLADFILGFDQGVTLEREWAGRNGGTVFFAPVLIRLSQIQQRPDYVKPRALLDVRVRKALAHAFDVPGALEVTTGGRGVAAWTMTSPRVDYYPTIQRAITERPYDPRKTQQLLEEAGLRRGSDGFYVSPAGERLEVELWNTGGTFEQENRIFADSVRKAGFDATPQTLGPALLRDAERRALIPGLFTGGAGDIKQRLGQHNIDSIPGPQNRWQGNNRGGWYSEEYQRVWEAFNATLERSERLQRIAEMERLINEDVGSIPHYFTVVITAHAVNLKGVAARMVPDAPLAVFQSWKWEWS